MHEDPMEEISYVRPDALPGVELLRVESSARLWRVYHDTYSICTVLDRGTRLRSEWRYRGRDHVATEASLMMMEPGELHVTRRISHAGSFRVLLIDPEVVSAAALDHGCSARDLYLRIPQANAAPLYRAFEALARRLDRDAEPLDVQERFHQALGLWLEHCTAAGAPRKTRSSSAPLSTAIEYLRAHCAERVRLSELAAAARVSPGHLIHCFTEQLGYSPHRYHLRMRLTRARRLLLLGVPILDVATALGFADQPAFSRHFKQAWGVTPGRYAEVTGVRRSSIRHPIA